jgi:NADH dehydrogenase [ubiquinone] 1 alpha subcomplex assembly factor 1
MAWLGRVMKDLGKYAHDVQLGQDLLPPAAESLMRFDAARVVSSGWRAWSDAPHGGTSTATLSWRERPEGATDGDAGAMVLEGVLRTETVAPLASRSKSAATAAADAAFGDASSSSSSSSPSSSSSSSTYELRMDNIAAASRRDAIARERNNAHSSSTVTMTSTTEPPAPRVTKSMRRSGFAGCSTVDLPDGEYFDLEAATALRYRVFSDGKPYVLSLKTDDWVTNAKDDLWQAFLFAPAGRWADVVVPMDRFLKTHRGRVMRHKYAMRQGRVIGFGVGVVGGGGGFAGDLETSATGPFKLEIASIAALRLSDAEIDASRRREEAKWAGGAGGRIDARGVSLGFAAAALRREADEVAAVSAAARRGTASIGGMVGGGKIERRDDGERVRYRGERLPSFLGMSDSEEEDDEDTQTKR